MQISFRHILIWGCCLLSLTSAAQGQEMAPVVDSLQTELEGRMEQYYDEYYNRYLEECQIGSYQPQWMNPDLVAEYGAGWELLDLYDVAMSLDHEEYLGHGGTERYYNAHCTPASIEGNRLTLAVNMRYNKGDYPVSQWQDLLQIIDAADEFTTRQVVFKK